MKTLTSLMFVALGASAHAADDVTLKLQQASASQALAMYSSLSGKQLIIASAATNHTRTVTLDIGRAVPKKDAAEQIGTALKQQAGVVITAIDATHVSVISTKK